MKEFDGKVAVVTGGSRGIGREIVLMLARNGAHVAFNFLSSKKNASALVDEVQSFGVKCLASQVDIRDFDAVKEWINDAKQDLGGLDFIINNVGIVRDKPMMMMLQEDWHDVIDTNQHGMFNATRAAIVSLLKQKSGSIVNISSVSGLIGLPGQTNYSAAKGAMNSFTKSLSKEVALYGIRVNAVAPGFIETDMIAHMNEHQQDKIKSAIPLGRFGNSHEVAKVVKFLLSERSSYMIGQIIRIDGGLAIR